jgi:hypothetical protein
MGRKALPSILLITAGLIIGMLYLADSLWPRPQAARHPGVVVLGAAASAAGASLPPRPASKAGSVSASAAIAPVAGRAGGPAAWHEIYTSADPYPAVMALRQARQAGSFGASRRLALACLKANLLLEWPEDWLAARAANDANYGQRLQARDRLRARCSRFTTGPEMFEFTKPLPGDAHGEKFMAAAQALRNWSRLSAAQFREALGEVAAQGHPDDSVTWLLARAAWRGQSWRDSRNAFGEAVSIAQLRLRSSPGLENDDIRLLLRCYEHGVCDGGHEGGLQRFNPETRQKILLLAADIEQGLRAGDVDALIGKP